MTVPTLPLHAPASSLMSPPCSAVTYACCQASSDDICLLLPRLVRVCGEARQSWGVVSAGAGVWEAEAAGATYALAPGGGGAAVWTMGVQSRCHVLQLTVWPADTAYSGWVVPHMYHDRLILKRGCVKRRKQITICIRPSGGPPASVFLNSLSLGEHTEV